MQINDQDLEQIRNQLVRSLSKRFGDRHLAEDAVQEAMLELVGKLPELSQRYLGAWLMVVAKRRALNMLRGRRRELARHQHYHRLLQESQIDGSSDDALRAKKLTAALAQLPLHYRQALAAVVEEGLSYREAADVLACTEGELRGRLQRARSRLRKLLKQEGQLGMLFLAAGSCSMAAWLAAAAPGMRSQQLVRAAGAVFDGLLACLAVLVLCMLLWSGIGPNAGVPAAADDMAVVLPPAPTGHVLSVRVTAEGFVDAVSGRLIESYWTN